jgi:5'-nucleotidase
VKPLTIALDVDEVVAALLPEWLRRYNLGWGDNLLAEDITEWDLTKHVKPECGKLIYSYLSDKTLYEYVLPIPYARDAAYTLLSRGHRVIYVTACPRGTQEQKREWLVRWGFLTEKNADRDFVPVSDKSLIRADVLFDDRPENISSFPGRGVIVTQPHNRRFPAWERIPSLKYAPDLLSHQDSLL